MAKWPFFPESLRHTLSGEVAQYQLETNRPRRGFRGFWPSAGRRIARWIRLLCQTSTSAALRGGCTGDRVADQDVEPNHPRTPLATFVTIRLPKSEKIAVYRSLYIFGLLQSLAVKA